VNTKCPINHTSTASQVGGLLGPAGRQRPGRARTARCAQGGRRARNGPGRTRTARRARVTGGPEAPWGRLETARCAAAAGWPRAASAGQNGTARRGGRPGQEWPGRPRTAEEAGGQERPHRARMCASSWRVRTTATVTQRRHNPTRTTATTGRRSYPSSHRAPTLPSATPTPHEAVSAAKSSPGPDPSANRATP